MRMPNLKPLGIFAICQIIYDESPLEPRPQYVDDLLLQAGGGCWGVALASEYRGQGRDCTSSTTVSAVLLLGHNNFLHVLVFGCMRTM